MQNLGPLLGYLSSLRVRHWNADTVTNEHKAIGELYESLDELTDDLVEVSLGKSGGQVTAESFDKCDCEDNASMIQMGCDIVKGLRSEFEAGEDDDTLNILADMEASLNKARYLLKAGSSGDVESPAEDIAEFDTEGME